MSQLTVFLARLLGLFTILVVAVMLLRGGAMVNAALADQPVMLTYGMISLALGLGIVLGHNVWSGGALPAVVTLVGWLMLAKGLVLLLVAPETITRIYAQAQHREHFNLYLLPSLVIGIYLTWAGFTARAR